MHYTAIVEWHKWMLTWGFLIAAAATTAADVIIIAGRFC